MICELYLKPWWRSCCSALPVLGSQALHHSALCWNLQIQCSHREERRWQHLGFSLSSPVWPPDRLFSTICESRVTVSTIHPSSKIGVNTVGNNIRLLGTNPDLSNGLLRLWASWARKHNGWIMEKAEATITGNYTGTNDSGLASIYAT